MTEQEVIESAKKGDPQGLQMFEEFLKRSEESGEFKTGGEYFLFLADLLGQVMDHAYSWGREHQFPLVIKYPQHQALQKIGWRIHKIGGEEKMREAIEIAARRNEDYSGLLNFFFRRIGQWMP